MSWFKKDKPQHSNHRGNRRRTLRPEVLQQRQLMAADLLNFEVDAQSGVMHIQGTDQADVVEVFVQDHGTADPLDDLVSIKATNANGIQRTSGSFQYSADGTLRIKSLKFEGFGGDDKFTNRTTYRSEAFGGDGDDFMIGGSNVDRFFGERGNDKLFGGGGSDFLNGGRDADALMGSGGNDMLLGGTHNDRIYGGWGDDVIRGGSGADYISGWTGDDDIAGGSGKDTIRGGRGNDLIVGGGGNDNLRGDDGNDTVIGDSGNDIMQGGNGDDFMYGGSGHDRMFGNYGNDLMIGGDGKDLISGNQGDDRLYGGDLSGLDVHRSDYGDPVIERKSEAQDWDKDILSGGSGTDWFGTADNGIFSDDEVVDKEAGEIEKDLDPFWATANNGTVDFLHNYGHHKDD